MFPAKFLKHLRKDQKDGAKFCSYLLRLNLANIPFVVAFSMKIFSHVPWVLNGKQISSSEPGSRQLMELTDLSSGNNGDLFKLDTEFLKSTFTNVLTTNPLADKDEVPMNLNQPFP